MLAQVTTRETNIITQVTQYTGCEPGWAQARRHPLLLLSVTYPIHKLYTYRFGFRFHAWPRRVPPSQATSLNPVARRTGVLRLEALCGVQFSTPHGSKVPVCVYAFACLPAQKLS